MVDPQRTLVLRMDVRIYSADYPRLFEDLLQRKKGRRRATRLFVLAMMGLLAERNMAPGILAVADRTRVEEPDTLDDKTTLRGALDVDGLSDAQLSDLFGTTTWSPDDGR